MYEEYKMLREEIMSAITNRRNYNSVLYTVSVALLAYAFESSNPLLFLLPFTIIFPLYTLIIKETFHEIRIGAYISVFIEKSTDIHWEQRLVSYDSLADKNKHTPFSLNAYLGVSFLCIFLSVIYTDYSIINLHNVICAILQISSLIVSLIMFVFKKPNYKEEKTKYISKWKKVKKLENLQLTSRHTFKIKRQTKCSKINNIEVQHLHLHK